MLNASKSGAMELSNRWRVWSIALCGVLLFVGVGCQKDKQMASEESEEKATAEQKQQKDESITEKMAKEHEGDSPEETGLAGMEPARPVHVDRVKYATVGDADIDGFYARPKDPEGPMPGIVAIHEWWGLNDNIRNVAKLLAGEGYQVLAVDLYEGKVAESPDKAKELMGKAMSEKSRLEENLRDAVDYLRGETEAPKVAAIGWCFGGGWSLQTALMFPDKVDASVIYYGELVTDAEKLEKLTMPIIGFFGGEDSSIPPSKVKEFEQAMKEAGNEATVHIYDGAGHAFANPSGDRYEPNAAEDAWNKTLTFLDEHLSVAGDTDAETEGSSDDEQSGESN